MAMQALVRTILQKAHSYEWSIQGLGMLRLYLSQECRLHIWDDSKAYAGDSVIHDHPWDFTSEIVWGRILNTLYTPDIMATGFTHHCQSILCGPGGGVIADKEYAGLITHAPTEYVTGQSYRQVSTWLHSTKADPGTVSIITRTFKEDRDHAKVYFPLGQDWTSGEPRKATKDEVEHFTQLALAHSHT